MQPQPQTKYPVDIIAAFNPLGQIKPLYLRVENDAHELITLTVQKILTHRTEQFGGLHCIHYYCEILQSDGEPFLCDIYYYIESHKWMIYHKQNG